MPRLQSQKDSVTHRNVNNSTLLTPLDLSANQVRSTMRRPGLRKKSPICLKMTGKEWLKKCV